MLDIDAFRGSFLIAMPWLRIVQHVLSYRWLQSSAVYGIELVDRLLHERLALPDAPIDLFGQDLESLVAELARRPLLCSW